MGDIRWIGENGHVSVSIVTEAQRTSVWPKDPGHPAHGIVRVGCGKTFWIGDGGEIPLGVIGEEGLSRIRAD